MAPTRTVRTKIPAKASTKGNTRPGKSALSTPSSRVPNPTKSNPINPKSNKQQKTRPTSAFSQKKKKRVYTAEELGVPTLNGIVPAGVTKPRGKKKGKVFVDDQEQMMTILKIVEAEAEGHIEGKMVRQRKLEEVREARRVEAEKKEARRKGKLEDVKDEIRLKKKARGKLRVLERGGAKADKEEQIQPASAAPRKRVSFA